MRLHSPMKISHCSRVKILGSLWYSLVPDLPLLSDVILLLSRQPGERGDVINLVDSDDEQIFQDAVPQLPPLTNGRQTTLVQIHRIPSSTSTSWQFDSLQIVCQYKNVLSCFVCFFLGDHEDTETADTSPQQQEDSVETEEPVELVSF